MIVTLDGRRLEDVFSASETLIELIDRVRAAHLPDRLVVSVARNGATLSEHELAAELHRPVGDAVQIDLDSADRRELAAEALRGLSEQCRAGATQLEALADELLGEQRATAIRRVGEFVELWQRARDVLAQGSQLLGEDLTASPYEGRTVREHLGELVTKLSELRDALEVSDHVLLTDLVRYELPPLAETWGDLFETVAEAVERG